MVHGFLMTYGRQRAGRYADAQLAQVHEHDPDSCDGVVASTKEAARYWAVLGGIKTGYYRHTVGWVRWPVTAQ